MLEVIFGAGMNTVRSSGFSRSATGRDNLPGEPPKGGTPNELSRVLSIKRRTVNPWGSYSCPLAAKLNIFSYSYECRNNFEILLRDCGIRMIFRDGF